MESAYLDNTERKLAELQIAHAQLHGLIMTLGRFITLAAPLTALEAAALADSMDTALTNADRLLGDARHHHRLSVATPRPCRLRVVAGRDTEATNPSFGAEGDIR